MSKTMKKIVFILAIVILCGIIQLIAPKMVNGFELVQNQEIKGGGWPTTLKDIKDGNGVIVYGNEIFRHEFILCYQSEQFVGEEIEYKIVNKFEVQDGKVTKYTAGNGKTIETNKEEVVKFINGLLCILSNINPDNYFADVNIQSFHRTLPVQQAVWQYLEDYCNNKTLSNFFDIPPQGSIEELSELAGKYYDAAKNNTMNYEGIIYILKPSNRNVISSMFIS